MKLQHGPQQSLCSTCGTIFYSVRSVKKQTPQWETKMANLFRLFTVLWGSMNKTSILKLLEDLKLMHTWRSLWIPISLSIALGQYFLQQETLLLEVQDHILVVVLTFKIVYKVVNTVNKYCNDLVTTFFPVIFSLIQNLP